MGIFSGYTTETFTGNMGGRAGAHQACAQEFPNSHLCHAAEYYLANSPLAPPATGAWIDFSTDGVVANLASVRQGRDPRTTNCTQWSDSAPQNLGTFLRPGADPTGNPCNNPIPLACCATPAKTHLAGFTANTTTGIAGGRPGMNAKCIAEFPGSHLCDMTEYLRSNSAVPVPAIGAWIDSSIAAFAQGTSTFAFNTGAPASGRVVTGDNPPCSQWTGSSLFGSPNGTLVSAVGAIAGDSCTNARPIACCL